MLFTLSPTCQDLSAMDYGVPTTAQCFELWQQYEMLENIREHSLMVAKVALYLFRNSGNKFVFSEEYVLAAALLHDLAKSYSIRHGGDHAQLGAAFVRHETGNPYLAQAVLFHVCWPWCSGEMSISARPFTLPLLVSYADKRVLHTDTVGIKERFDDLLVRYGTTPIKRRYILMNYEQSLELENAFAASGVRIDFDAAAIESIQIDVA